MRIDSRKPKAAALSATLAVALLVGAGVTEAHAATLSDAVGSTPSETTLMQPVDYRGDGYGSMQEWNAFMGGQARLFGSSRSNNHEHVWRLCHR